MSLYTILAMGIRFLEAGCDEHEVAMATKNQLDLLLKEKSKEVMDGEITFLSKRTTEELEGYEMR